MPVSAADSGTLLYNGVELPSYPSDWDSSYHKYAVIRQTSSVTDFVVSKNSWYVDGGNLCTLRDSGQIYRLKDGVWSFVNSFSSYSQSFSSLIWANYDVLTANGDLYLSASVPVEPNIPTPITGTMEILSQQVLDDSASFVTLVSGLSDTSPAFTYGYTLYSDGTEIKSNVSEDSFTGTDNRYLHTTITNLTPETVYEITFTLYADGEPTDITASTSFTTLGSGGAGEGESGTIDYTGQLNDIQQGVDEVGTKLDGVQDTLTETKEEITSLPGKIASAILDGIKSLFVPSEEDLTEIKDKYESMLSEKLGFIWQAFDLLTTFVSDLQTSLESGEAYEFNFPGVKLPMQGEEFVLVPETPVSLDNELMDVLRPVVGTIVSMIAVIAFVNMAHDYVLAIVSGVSAYQFERRKD